MQQSEEKRIQKPEGKRESKTLQQWKGVWVGLRRYGSSPGGSALASGGSCGSPWVLLVVGHFFGWIWVGGLQLVGLEKNVGEPSTPTNALLDLKNLYPPSLDSPENSKLIKKRPYTGQWVVLGLQNPGCIRIPS
ncbi:unnamed protein product [Prunus armeniaca]